jgi:septal ring factor EnvC (AmiA/AmiB activator)
MPDNVQSAMLEILKRIQSDVSDIKVRLEKVEGRLEKVEGRLEKVEGRLEKVEDLAKQQRRDSAAMLVMMRGTVGVFNERMDALEIDMVALKENN